MAGPSGSIYCIHCGNTLPAVARFCNRCGRPQPEPGQGPTDAAHAPTQLAPAAAKPAPAPEPRRIAPHGMPQVIVVQPAAPAPIASPPPSALPNASPPPNPSPDPGPAHPRAHPDPRLHSHPDEDPPRLPRRSRTGCVVAALAVVLLLSGGAVGTWLAAPDLVRGLLGVAAPSATTGLPSAPRDAPIPPRSPLAAPWSGSEGGTRAFTAAAPQPGPDGATAFAYSATDERGAVEIGTLLVWVFGGRRVHAELLAPDGRTPVRFYDGMLDVRGLTLTGVSWPAADRPTATGTFWLATLEPTAAAPPPSPAAPVNLNLATIGELERAGFSPATARTIVEGRVRFGPYLSAAGVLLAEGLTPEEQRLIRERTRVH